MNSPSNSSYGTAHSNSPLLSPLKSSENHETEGLTIQDGLLICADDELRPYLSHLDHFVIIAMDGEDVGIRDPKSFPKPVNGHYDLRIIESLLIQSR